MSQYVCTECGKVGTEDDGISGAFDDCPDEDCEGTMRWTSQGYREIYDEAITKLMEALSGLPGLETSTEVTLTQDELHMLLDAHQSFIGDLPSLRDGREPWKEYG